jgi:3-dehydroquinate dehydratase
MQSYGISDAQEGYWTASPIGRSRELLDKGEGVKGVILNAGGYTHTSVALRDAVACCEVPVVEVHISDITKREEFRRISLLTDVCAHSIIGHGIDGYQEAVDWILNNSDSKK